MEVMNWNDGNGFYVFDVPNNSIAYGARNNVFMSVYDEHNSKYNIEFSGNSIIDSSYDYEGRKHYTLTFLYDDNVTLWDNKKVSEMHRLKGEDIYNAFLNGDLDVNTHREGEQVFNLNDDIFKRCVSDSDEFHRKFIDIDDTYYDKYQYVFVMDEAKSVEESENYFRVSHCVDSRNNAYYMLDAFVDNKKILDSYKCNSNIMADLIVNMNRSYGNLEYQATKERQVVEEVVPMNRFDFETICKDVKTASYSGVPGVSKRDVNLVSEDGDTQLDFHGFVIEEGYEYFVPSISIRENGELLFMRDATCVGSYHNEPTVSGKFNSLEETIGYLNGVYGNTKFAEVEQGAPFVSLDTDAPRWEREEYRKQKEVEAKYSKQVNESKWRVFENISEKNISKGTYTGNKVVRLYDDGHPLSMLVNENYIKPDGTNKRGFAKFSVVVPSSVDTLLAKGVNDYGYRDRYVGELLDIHKASLEEAKNYSAIQNMVSEAASGKVVTDEDIKEK